MTDVDEEKATCRGCRRELIGKPYYMGGSAYLPGSKMERAKINHYGGFVCSPACDFRASLQLEQSMPGHGSKQTSIGFYAQDSYDKNWKDKP